MSERFANVRLKLTLLVAEWYAFTCALTFETPPIDALETQWAVVRRLQVGPELDDLPPRSSSSSSVPPGAHGSQ